jgi:hypothetical protein
MGDAALRDPALAAGGRDGPGYRVVFAPDRRGRRGRDREAPARQPAGDFRGSVLAARLDFDLHRRTVAPYPIDFPISRDFNALQQGKFSLHSISAA